MSAHTSPFDLLPTELWISVAESTPITVVDLCSLGRVCRGFRSLVREVEAVTFPAGALLQDTHIRSLCRMFPSLKSVGFQANEGGIALSCNSFDAMRVLPGGLARFPPLLNASDSTLRWMASLGQEGNVPLDHPLFTSETMSLGAKQSWSSGAGHTLPRSDALTDHGFEVLPKLFARSLTALDVSMTEITDQALVDHVGHLEGLTMLDLSMCDALTPQGMVAVASLPRLTTLSLSMASGMTDSFLVPLVDLRSTLTSLDISHCRAVTDAGLRGGVAQLTALRHLNLNNCPRISNSGMEAVGSLGALKSLDLRECERVTGRILPILGPWGTLIQLQLSHCEVSLVTAQALCEGQRLLAKLSLTTCHFSDNRVFDHILQGLPNLCEVDIRGSSGVGDFLLRASQSLTSLVLSECGEVTDDSLSRIGSHVPRLESLNVSYITGISDRGVACLSSIPNLISLDCRGCRELTDASLVNLACSHPSLAALDIGYLPHVTDDGVRALGDLARLRSLGVSSDLGVTKSAVCEVANRLGRLQVYYYEASGKMEPVGGGPRLD